ncbi:DUF418 domain-containing protein [Pseudogracilibacillus sp. ICA-222130]|uniref:DUF418 domain-containing protein n=1 Tax=Pseudogracilibacillus sp. ICA-222130 TaxID=3134655 RepID=UPI0030BE6640
MQPTVNKQRIHLIDLIRGFALLGLPFVNVLGLWSDNVNLSGEHTDIIVQRFLFVFVEGRFFAIFSFLFGVGMYLFLSRAKEKHANYRFIFIRRMAILFVIGFIHQLFQPGEALLFYAILGIILLPFFHLLKQWNLILGVIGIIVGSVWSAKILLPLPYMLLGLAFGQYRIFEKTMSYKKSWIFVAAISFVATLIATVYLWMQAPSLGMTSYMEGVELTELQMDMNRAFYEFSKIALMLAPIFTIFYVSSLVVVEPFIGKILTPLYAYGRMAFTNYLGQTVMLLLVLQFFVKDSIVSYSYATISCAIIVLLQIAFSAFWLKYFKFGPFEWLWRCGTYGEILPIKK